MPLNPLHGLHCPLVMVVIPAFNEAENIGKVLSEIPKDSNSFRLQVLVIDDGSTDCTAEIAHEFGALVVQTKHNQGQGAAIRIGCEFAISAGAQIVVTMDADGQHDPRKIGPLVQPILNGNLDFTIASRMLIKGWWANPWRRLGVVMFNLFVNLLTGTQITDCSSGFRALRSSKISKLTLCEPQFAAGEMIVKCAKHGLRIGEVPIAGQPRASGETKKGNDLSYAVGFARGVLRAWWHCVYHELS